MKAKDLSSFFVRSFAVFLALFAIRGSRAANHDVVIQNSSFVPPSITINVGDTVTWRQQEQFMIHTTTSGVSGTPDGKWDSGNMAVNQSFSHTFDAAGTFPYFCIPHASFMTGTVIVEGGASPGPTVSITAPANNATFNGPADITISADASVQGGTIVMVEFFDGTTFIGMDHDAPFSVPATLAVGTHSLTAKATSNTGATATSAAVTVTVNGAAANPTVAITAPANNSTFTGPTNLTVTADAAIQGGTIAMVEFFDGANLIGMDHDAPFSIEANLAVGNHSLTAKATASTGATATSAAVNVTVNASSGGGGTRIEDPYPPIAKGDTTIELETVAEGLVSPLGLAAPDDGSGRLFIFDQVGFVHVIANGAKLPTPLLDVSGRLVSLNPNYDERGLLGLATHPNFAVSQTIYTYTSEPNGPTADFPVTIEGGTNNHQGVLAEWKIDPANTNRVDPATRREILRIDKPQGNHNGGSIHFGPDGMLYLAFGDGGAADDEGPGHSPDGNGQDLNKILGKVIRIDVDARTSPNGQYGVPADNPFVGKDGLDEIYALGFRNPYSWSFDRLTGEMYVADVGQNQIEELDRVFKGANYGWRIKEGSFYFDPAGTNDGFITTAPVRDVPGDLVDPIAEYDHGEGDAIVGGYVYHGTKIPALIGRYITGDLGETDEAAEGPSGRLFYLDRSQFKELRIGAADRKLGLWLKGFGQDRQGELYVFGSTDIGPGGSGGKVLKIVPAPADLSLAISTATNGFNVTFTGGVGPFVLQEKESLGDELWENEDVTAARSLVTPNDDEVGLLRGLDMAGNGPIGFTVYMTAAAERPNPVDNTNALGTGALTLEGNTLNFDIRYSGLTGPATAAHIHGPATAAQAAGVLINLAPYNGGAFSTSGVLSGSVTLTPEQKATLLAGRTYVNIHTAANGGGEMRGQIAPMVFTADLNGESERPEPVESDGEASGIFFLVGNKLTFNLNYGGLSAAASAAHIHGPASEDESAGVMVNFAPFNGGAFGVSGTMGGTATLTPDQLAAVVDGRTYVNIHTPNHASGEIRGQLRPRSTMIPLSASLSGAAERPNPVTTTSGVGSGTLALEGNRLHFNIRYSGLTGPATAAHIHGLATAAQAAGVMINLAPFNGGAFGAAGSLAGSVTLTDDQRAGILEGRTYANIHTAANGGGEIRGQIIPSVMQVVLSGASERPASVQTTGRGRGTLLLAGDQLTVNATYSGLPVPATAAHIHGSASTEAAAGVMVNLVDLNGGAFGTNGSFAGTVTLTPDQLAALVDQLTYMNIHTATHSGGEIRGQITR